MKVLIAGAALALAAVGLAGCGDARPCVSGHYTTTIVPIYTGSGSVTFIPQQIYICDERATK